MHIIGLTGGICSGKSTVSEILESFGAKVIDADKLGHAAYQPNTSCYDKLVSHFGEGIISDDKTINRPVLGSIVFSDPSKMVDLQNIVWPEIRTMIVNKLSELKSQGVKSVVIEAAIMIEAKWQDLVNSLWVVTVSQDTALSRLKKRNGLSVEDALKRINSQMASSERVAFADVVINNDEGVDRAQLEDRVRREFDVLMGSK
jgi:phosphopantetheine adenylyltransferase/dephospho-CoA kinase